MKTLVGIDLEGYWRQVVPLLKRMRFEANEATFYNAVESVLPDGAFVNLPDTHPIQQMMDENEAEGRRQAEEARAIFGDGTVEVHSGEATAKLLHFAENHAMDLVAIGSERKSTLGSLFFGSVSQGLLTGAKCSLLVGKNPPTDDGPVTAVLATDHSIYANRSIEWLLERKPLGIGKLVILTAATVNPLIGSQIMQHVENMNETVLEFIIKGLRDQNDHIAHRFRQLGIDAVGEVRQEHPSHAIESAMKEHGAELLIVGAQGHGFLERLRIGSTSFEQVVNTPHNVLVIRPH